MNKILFAITEGLLTILRQRGVDISKLKPQTKKEKEVEELSSQLYDLQAVISIKRAEIVETQRNLIINVEPVLLNVLAETEDNWQKTTLTKIWMEKLNEINTKIEEHEELLGEFELTYYNLENVKKSL
jgi:hypothetical protein